MNWADTVGLIEPNLFWMGGNISLYNPCSLTSYCAQFDPREVIDQLDLMRAEAKGQEFNEAVAKDKIEATLERNLVRYPAEGSRGL